MCSCKLPRLFVETVQMFFLQVDNFIDLSKIHLIVITYQRKLWKGIQN